MTNNKYIKGMTGQDEAEAYLINKGCQVLYRNYRLRSGEIDLIVQDGTYIVFVEVKYRQSVELGFPREAVTRSKQHKIIKTALHFIAETNRPNQDYRFDVVEVLGMPEKFEVTHIINAFTC